jgi:cellulose synthase/poly-beta-1,6-N-acetylglucosamine synthase-like glycosyltransferase
MIHHLFVTGTVVLWLSTLGYLLVLAALRRRQRALPAPSTLPDIAVVIPTLNEERLIAAKLDDLARTDYPRERVTVLVVDGGSTDATCTLVEQAMARTSGLRLMRVAHPRGQADQVCQALEALPHEVVVVTDADARLEPSCMRELVLELARDPQLAVAGALVRPETTLLEERLYWWALTRLWWLEGEALSAAMVSGACYAVRASAVRPRSRDSRALDVSLAAGASARGMAARLCRAARATEVRAPRSPREFVRFRRRRGAGYLDEIRRAPGASAPLRWRVARAVRLWQMRVVPWIALALALAAPVLLGTPRWGWPLLAAAAFLLPVAGLLAVSDTMDDAPSWWRLALGAARALALTWLALALLRRQPLAPEQAA